MPAKLKKDAGAVLEVVVALEAPPNAKSPPAVLPAAGPEAAASPAGLAPKEKGLAAEAGAAVVVVASAGADEVPAAKLNTPPVAAIPKPKVVHCIAC